MPEYEHPGVHVEEVAGGGPIEGVPTDGEQVPAWVEGPWFFRSALIGSAIFACLGILAAIVRGNVVVELILTPAGLVAFVALLVSAIVLSMVRAWVEWRRRKAGRPQLPLTDLMFRITVVSIAAVIAGNVGTIALVASLVTGQTSLPLAVGTNLLLGSMGILLSTRSLRDVLLLIEASRDRGVGPAAAPTRS